MFPNWLIKNLTDSKVFMAIVEKNLIKYKKLGAVAGLEACSLVMQAALSLIPTSGTFFLG